jgi:hypothetical protein
MMQKYTRRYEMFWFYWLSDFENDAGSSLKM